MDPLEISLARRFKFAQERKRLDDEIANIDSALREYLDARSITTESAGPYTVKVVESARHSLDKQRLIELGVLPATLNAAMTTKKIISLRVTTAEEPQQRQTA